MSRTSTYGQDFKPLGFLAINLFKLATACIETKREDVEKVVASPEVLGALQKVFLSTPANNIIHNCYLTIINTALEKNSGAVFNYVRIVLTLAVHANNAP